MKRLWTRVERAARREQRTARTSADRTSVEWTSTDRTSVEWTSTDRTSVERTSWLGPRWSGPRWTGPHGSDLGGANRATASFAVPQENFGALTFRLREPGPETSNSQETLIKKNKEKKLQKETCSFSPLTSDTRDQSILAPHKRWNQL